MSNPDLINSATYTAAPAPYIEGKVGSSYWGQVCTVFTDAGEWYLVTGYDSATPFLSKCRQIVPVSIKHIHQVIDRDHPAIAALNMRNAPHTHHTGP